MRLLSRSKILNVRVVTAESELEFSVQDNIIGLRLFDQVVRTIGLREVWYFGLIYEDSNGAKKWLHLKKKLSSIQVKNSSPILLHFCAKFYPEDASNELIQETTQRLFFLQVKEDILRGTLSCPPETAVLLASYALQAKYSVYEPHCMSTMSISLENLLPSSVLQNHDIDNAEWMDMITKWCKEHADMSSEAAMLAYLNIAQELETYGVDFFPVTNKRKTKLLLGVDAVGLSVYLPPDKNVPKVGFSWSEIRNISFSDRRFTIKPIENKSPDFIFFTEDLKDNKHILALCVGNSELYIRRRQPETIEIQQMRSQAQEIQMIRIAERQRLQKEIQAREEAEKRLRELERALGTVSTQQSNLILARNASQLAPVPEHSNGELNLLDETYSSENYENASGMSQSSQLSENSSSSLVTNEYKSTRLDSINRNISPKQITQIPHNAADGEVPSKFVGTSTHVNPSNLKAVKNPEHGWSAQNEVMNIAVGSLVAKKTSYSGEDLFDVIQLLDASIVDEDFTAASSSSTCLENKFEFPPAVVPSLRSEEIRQTVVSTNVDLRSKLEKLKFDLKAKRVASPSSPANQYEDRSDKFDTLRQIRRGNTQKRIDEFESI